jgi:hypothetical protein
VNSDQPPGPVEARLDRLRGRALPVNHNARTISALAANPGCARRARMDAAGVDKQKMELLDAHPSAEPVHLGVPVKFPDGWEAHQSFMAHLAKFRVPK